MKCSFCKKSIKVNSDNIICCEKGCTKITSLGEEPYITGKLYGLPVSVITRFSQQKINV